MPGLRGKPLVSLPGSELGLSSDMRVLRFFNGVSVSTTFRSEDSSASSVSSSPFVELWRAISPAWGDDISLCSEPLCLSDTRGRQASCPSSGDRDGVLLADRCRDMWPLVSLTFRPGDVGVRRCMRSSVYQQFLRESSTKLLDVSTTSACSYSRFPSSGRAAEHMRKTTSALRLPSSSYGL